MRSFGLVEAGSPLVLRPEQFLAVGNGVANDYLAWWRMARYASWFGKDVQIECAPGAIYYIDEVMRWEGDFTVDTIGQSNGGTHGRTIRTATDGIDDIAWIGIQRLVINGNGATIRNAPIHYTEADIFTLRRPKATNVCPLWAYLCDYVEINDLTGDGGWLQSTCDGVQFLPAAIDTSADTIAAAGHGIPTGSALVLFVTPQTGVAPGGLTHQTTYYVIAASADTIKLASSLANAEAGTAIDITSQGTGTHTLKLSIGQRFSCGFHAQGCREVVINDSEFCNYMQDGFIPLPRFAAGYTFYEGVIGDAVETVTINNSRFDRNGRQGISIIGCTDTFTMTGGSCDDTGFPSASPPWNCPSSVTPTAGIDIEPDRKSKHQVGDVVLNGVSLKNNFGSALAVSTAEGTSNVSPTTFDPEDVDATTNRISIAGHFVPDLQRAPDCGWKVRFSTTGTLPAPLQAGTDYYPFGRDAGAAPNYFRVAETYENAIAGIAVDLMDGGTGTHTVYMHDQPSGIKSVHVYQGEWEHPPPYASLRTPSNFVAQFGGCETLIEEVTIRNLNPKAWLHPIGGDSRPIFRNCEIEAVGAILQLTLGTTEVRNTFAYDWRIEGGTLTYIGNTPIMTANSTGLIYARYGDFSIDGLTIDLGAAPHDGTGTDKVIDLRDAKGFDNVTINTSYSPPGAQKLEIDLTNLTTTPTGNSYLYSGLNNPYQVTGP